MHGDLNMQGHKIKNVANPVDKKDVSNKEYIDKIKNEIDLHLLDLPNYLTKNDIDKQTIRSFKYYMIHNQFKPKFWFSSFLPEVTNEGVKEKTNVIVSNSAIKFTSNDYVISEYEFGLEYTFVGIVKRITPGRTLSSQRGNKFLGFWKNFMNVVWHDSPIHMSGTSSTDDKQIFVYESSKEGKKKLYNGDTLIFEKDIVTNSWSNLVIGDTIFKEGADFMLYECIGFNSSLQEDDIKYIISIINIT